MSNNQYPKRVPNKDCSDCPHSLENKPENADKEWKDLPCATCIPMEPQVSHSVTMAQIHLVEQRSQGTWGTGFLDEGEHALPVQEAARLGRIFQTFDPDYLADFCETTAGFTDTEIMAFYQFSKSFTTVEIKVIGCLATLGWSARQCRVAEMAGVSKQAVNNTMKRIAAKYPTLKSVLQPNIRRRRGE